MHKPKKGRKVALVAGLALVVLSVGMVWTYWEEIRSWYALWRDFESLGRNAQGYSEYRHQQTGIVFVGLPGGTFYMGSEEHQAQSEDGPVHKVMLSPFLIAKHEVTQAQWKKVMGNYPSEFKGENFPVETVSWADCKEFCETSGILLPTEAQWEYACCAGTMTLYSSGHSRDTLDPVGWNSGNSDRKTHPVGSKLPNAFGLHDMHGNVAELCEDVYDKHFYSAPEAMQKDPICTSGSEKRVMRGGDWMGACRSAQPSGFRAEGRAPFTGFRPAAPSP